MSSNYEASVILAVYFKDMFNDLIHVGIAHSPEEARALELKDIYRVIEDFGQASHCKCQISLEVSEYDNALTTVSCIDEYGVVGFRFKYYTFVADNKEE